MEERSMKNPFFLHHENRQEMLHRSCFHYGNNNNSSSDDQQLSLAFSRMKLSCPPPPFEVENGCLENNYWCPLSEQGGGNMNNVHYLRRGQNAQNGVFEGSFVGPGPTSGAHGDFLVGPVLGFDVLGGRCGGGSGGGSYGGGGVANGGFGYDGIGHGGFANGGIGNGGGAGANGGIGYGGGGGIGNGGVYNGGIGNGCGTNVGGCYGGAGGDGGGYNGGIGNGCGTNGCRGDGGGNGGFGQGGDGVAFGNGRSVDFVGPSYGVPQRLEFYDVGHRGNNVYCQTGQTYGTNSYDPFSQIKNLTSGNENGTYPQRLNFDDVGHSGNVYCQSGQYYGTNNIHDHFLPSKNLMDNIVPCDNAFCIKDFKGMIVLFAQDQSLSKFLQKKIEEQTFEDNEFVVAEVIYSVCDLMKNQFGGYFIQKLFGVCNEDQRTRMIVAASRVSSELVDVCLCSHGAKTVQMLMEKLNAPQQISLVISALCPGAVVLCNDPHGQHVIRCCLTNFSYEFNKLLLEKIVQNCFQIATNKCGCCVLQSCVEYSHGEPRERLVDEIIAKAVILAQDPYGNYVVQHLVGLKISEITADLIQHLRGKFTALSCNKFASNVVEKLLLEADEKYATAITEDLLENPQAASMLLINPYGNFVIQTALTVSKGEVFKKLLNLILENAPSIRNNIYAEKIFAWFEKKNISLGKYTN